MLLYRLVLWFLSYHTYIYSDKMEEFFLWNKKCLITSMEELNSKTILKDYLFFIDRNNFLFNEALLNFISQILHTH